MVRVLYYTSALLICNGVIQTYAGWNTVCFWCAYLVSVEFAACCCFECSRPQPRLPAYILRVCVPAVLSTEHCVYVVLYCAGRTKTQIFSLL